MFRQDFSGPALLKDLPRHRPVRGYHPLWRAFPDASGLTWQATGLVRVRSPLLAESLLMSFPPATEMFQFAGFASTAYGFSGRYPKRVGCPIRRSSDQRVLPSPRSLSQGATSFIASRCQGIHRMPFFMLEILKTSPCANARLRLESVSAYAQQTTRGLCSLRLQKLQPPG